MTAAEWAAVALLGGAGALCRVFVQVQAARLIPRPWPYGTLAVNVAGSFALGLLVAAGGVEGQSRVVALGFIGSFTTFSTWLVEAEELGRERRGRADAVYIATSLVLGLGAAWLGWAIG